jgi:adenine-specific DNA glycosylase
VILGTGKDVPALNAALHAIGRVICTPRAPKCSQCPVVMHCLTTDSKAAE